MTTTADLRAFLDAHGVDGAPDAVGWFAVRFIGGEVGIAFADGRGDIAGAGVAETSWVAKSNGKVEAVHGERAGRCGSFFAYNILRHAPLTLAPTAGRDLDAETAAGVQAARDDLVGLAGKVSG